MKHWVLCPTSHRVERGVGLGQGWKHPGMCSRRGTPITRTLISLLLHSNWEVGLASQEKLV